MNSLVYDIEIIKAVPQNNVEIQEGIEYCAGWDDKANMGVSCVCAFDFLENRMRVFFEDNKDAFTELYYSREELVGFNNRRFDDVVLQHSGWIDEPRSDAIYDILERIWVSLGHDPDHFTYKTHTGYGLDQCAKANGMGCKTGWGGSAPIDFQNGAYGKLVDYCINDVTMTLKLYQRICDVHYIINPKDINQVIYL